MLGIVVLGALVVVGAFASSKRKRIKRLSEADFEDVPAKGFGEWHSLRLKSINLIIWGSWGGVCVFIAYLAIGIVLGLVLPDKSLPNAMSAPPAVYGLYIGLVALFLLGLTISAILGSKAQRVQRTLGIKWPKKTHKVKVICPNCGKRLSGATSDMIGNIGVCPSCKTEFEIPAECRSSGAEFR